ncbi:glycosyltransferase family 32 protein [Candidatus Schmidhempelia bombi]|uniref:Mannosyltransferase n=1 Tax=Candidatus Schmidhempelia bombi str. Bimp TaxID=1387197 RepID=A0AB94IC19_9GAMM|nr:glycosyltransferase [Candidatus Schmidhempelia bombi]TEA26955.1 hypothetical protein O970_05980 [Candidatus Schmidhempelia bombi str. Bimp]
MKIEIPKELSHIWIGPRPAPKKWMKTWIEKHPEWNYTLYDNEFLENYDFKNRKLINEYMRRGKYAGVADLMRYEILYKFGGLMIGADSICYHNTDELFTKKCAYTVYENEFIRGKLVSPIQACEPGNDFVGFLIEELSKLSPHDLYEPWITTGNLFVSKMIEKYNPDLVIFPSHYLIPIHYTGIVYSGNDKVYAKQLFGSTHNSYNNKPVLKEGFIKKIKNKIKKKTLKKELELLHRNYQNDIDNLFTLDFSNNQKK